MEPVMSAARMWPCRYMYVGGGVIEWASAKSAWQRRSRRAGPRQRAPLHRRGSERRGHRHSGIAGAIRTKPSGMLQGMPLCEIENFRTMEGDTGFGNMSILATIRVVGRATLLDVFEDVFTKSFTTTSEEDFNKEDFKFARKKGVNWEIPSQSQFRQRLRVLDVGSCYNPFTQFEEFGEDSFITNIKLNHPC